MLSGDLEFESRFQDYLDDGFRPYFSEKRDAPALENTLSKSPSLLDLLSLQANVTFTDKADKEAAQLVIGNIDEDGYLRATEEELSRQAGVSVERVHEIREKIKTFDPVGVGSLDLQEALLAQMDYRQIEDETARRIVQDHLELVKRSDFVQLAKVLGIPAQRDRWPSGGDQAAGPGSRQQVQPGEDNLRCARHQCHERG